MHRPDLPAAAAVRLKRDVTAVWRPGGIFVPAFACQLQGLLGGHVGDIDVECPVAVPGERQETAVGRPRGRIHMPAHGQQLALVGSVRADHVNPGRAAAVRNERDLSPGLRIPPRRYVHRVARASQFLRVRPVAVRDVYLHRAAVLARSESDPPVGADRGRSRRALEPRGADDQPVLAANDNVRIAVTVRDVGQPLAVGRERREERDRTVAREGPRAVAVVIHLVDFAVGDVGDLRLSDALLPGQKPDDLVGQLVGHLARLAAHRGGEQLLPRLDVIKEALSGVRAGQIAEGHVIALDRVVRPIFISQRGGVGEQRLRIKALADQVGDAREFQVAPERVVESPDGGVETALARVKIGDRQRSAGAWRDNDLDLLAQVLLGFLWAPRARLGQDSHRRAEDCDYRCNQNSSSHAFSIGAGVILRGGIPYFINYFGYLNQTSATASCAPIKNPFGNGGNPSLLAASTARTTELLTKPFELRLLK